MSNSPTLPRPRDVRNACHLIRANWTSAQRRERRLVAATKRQQLMPWLSVQGTQLTGHDGLDAMRPSPARGRQAVS